MKGIEIKKGKSSQNTIFRDGLFPSSISSRQISRMYFNIFIDDARLIHCSQTVTYNGITIAATRHLERSEVT